MVSEKTTINKKVKIKPCAHIFEGEIGVATMVTENLSFYVNLEREGYTTGLWFAYEELEFLGE